MPLDALIAGRIATFAGAHGFGWVEALGIRGGRVAFAGSAIELETRADPHTRRFELEPGEIAIPGLTDAHLHFLDAALATEQVDLTSAPSLDAGLAMVRDADRALPPGVWLLGGGWDQRRWGGWPSAAALDGAIPGRPVALWSFDHHALWASSAALARSGVATTTSEPAGGIIRRLSGGAPEGVVLESAVPLILNSIPAPDGATVRRTMAVLGRRLLELGVVGLHDPGNVSPDTDLGGLEVYATLADAGELAVRIHAGFREASLEAAIARGIRSGDRIGQDPDSRAKVGWLKLFADGTLGSQTAALLEPREGSDDRGAFRDAPAAMRRLAARAADNGIATHIHAIGDAAVRAALDALGPTTARAPLMPRLEHVQLVDPADRQRFGAAGIAASVQPIHLREDAATASRDWGPRAEACGYSWRTLLDAGTVLAFGTDAPVEPIDPWPGIAMAVLRRDPSWGPDASAFGAHEALDLASALRAATLGPALMAREPDRGRLTVGARADLIVLPAAPREPDARDAAFASVRPRLVLLDGEPVVER